jgi:hypothetical protein
MGGVAAEIVDQFVGLVERGVSRVRRRTCSAWRWIGDEDLSQPGGRRGVSPRRPSAAFGGRTGACTVSCQRTSAAATASHPMTCN